MLPPWLIEKQRQDEQRKHDRLQQRPAIRIDDGRLAWEQEQKRKEQEDEPTRRDAVDFQL